MGIPIEKSFVVKAPAAAVWEFLTDPGRVASCLPGAAITGKEDDQAWGGTMTVKVGPVVASYRGKLRFERLDAAAREAEIAASGQETRGKGGADMRMKSRVVERSPGETEVTVSSDVNVVGVLAQFGRGMIQDVSDQLFQKFTEAMRRELEAPAASAAAAPAAATAAASTAPTTTTAAARAPAPALPPPAAGNVLDVGALGAAAAGRAAVRALRRPGFWIAVAAAALLVYWLLHLSR
jgi:carbon monoxide dehydrogenase subunit G